MRAKAVILVFDIGKTNKKVFLFDESYDIVYEQSAQMPETVDEDGDACEDLQLLNTWMLDSVREVLNNGKFGVKAVNISAYGASFVYVDEDGQALTALYNYLKPYPGILADILYDKYGGSENFAVETASPLLGSLNSGLQLFRLKQEKPEFFSRVKFALHLPQYLSFLLSSHPLSDITSIGCHTSLWNFARNNYHQWVCAEELDSKLPSIEPYDKVVEAEIHGHHIRVGGGLHDSSAALIPYLINFQEPFVLLSTGTWSISLNPFNDLPLTPDELAQDCLCYLQYKGRPVKASRYFAGKQHEDGVKKIAAQFQLADDFYKDISYNPAIVDKLKETTTAHIKSSARESPSPSTHPDPAEAYHRLMFDIVATQVISTQLILHGSPVKRLFVDGGFGRNHIFMHLLAQAFPGMEVYAASMAQASALGAALSIHSSWNSQAVPTNLIQLEYYSGTVPSMA